MVEIVPDPNARLSSLTEREHEVLAQVARGLSNNDIADALCISEGTVRKHLTSVFDKLDVSSRTQAAVWMWAHGFGPEGTA